MVLKGLFRKYRWLIILVVLLSTIFISATEIMPRNFRGLGFTGLFFLLDYYLYFSIYPFLKRSKKAVFLFLTAIYWLPLVVLVSTILNSLIVPFHEMPALVSTVSMGIVVTGIICKLPALIFLEIADIVKYITVLFSFISKVNHKKRENIKRKRALLSIGWSLSFVFLFLFLVGQFYWVHDFEVKKETITFKDLPKNFDGLKIVQISDIHLGSWLSKSAMENFVNEINGLNPDLLFFTGDMVTLTSNEMRPFLEDFKKINARFGIFAILGNHDYGSYVRGISKEDQDLDLKRLCSFYYQIGWQLLRNQSVEIEIDSSSIAIIGVENWSKYSKHFPSSGDLELAMDGVEDIPFQLLLSHDPTHWDSEVSIDYPSIDLTLSGHTHAAQFGIDCCGFKLSPSALMFPHWSGLYKNNEQYLYVNIGAGSVGFPGRIGMRPEITLLELKSRGSR